MKITIMKKDKIQNELISYRIRMGTFLLEQVDTP